MTGPGLAACALPRARRSFQVRARLASRRADSFSCFLASAAYEEKGGKGERTVGKVGLVKSHAGGHADNTTHCVVNKSWLNR